MKKSTLLGIAIVAFVTVYYGPGYISTEDPHFVEDVTDTRPVYDSYEPDFYHQELDCLALNIYHEARGESRLGQVAVAYVTMNRVDHTYWPDTVCEVVYQDSQFSWTIDSLSDEPTDMESWGQAMAIARAVYEGAEDDPTNGAVFYYATYISTPGFASHPSTTVSAEIGVHRFYTWNGSWN